MNGSVIELLSSTQLTYSATARCPCGAGLAYEAGKVTPGGGSWLCSAVLLGQVELDEQRSKTHNASRTQSFHNEAIDTAGQMHAGYPFTMFEVKSEAQPSADGATTRPPGTHVEWEPHCKCKNCGNEFVGDARSPNAPRAWYDGLDCPRCHTQVTNHDGSSNEKIEVRMKNKVVDDLRQRTQNLRRELLSAPVSSEDDQA